jgi:2-polyprenyl-3-methyl-5-hydroxy-6-metoxy-1,4-benzoquinol methylase
VQPAAQLSRWELKKILGAVYGRLAVRGRRLSWHERLTSVFRPLYAPFGALLQWVPAKARVLDVGCGSGAFLFLADEVKGLAASLGIDSNAKSIALAQAACTSSQLEFVVGVEARPEVLRNSSVVALIDVIHHVPENEKQSFLRGLLQGMSGGALVLVKDLDPEPAWKAWANRITDYLSTRSIVSYLSKHQVEKILSEEGFDVLSSARLDDMVWSHFLVVGQKRGAAPG